MSGYYYTVCQDMSGYYIQCARILHTVCQDMSGYYVNTGCRDMSGYYYSVSGYDSIIVHNMHVCTQFR